ncbi:NAD-dependent epimerase/dehydratase family protein [Streptomyces sp. MST-110588]|uniref:NAD-dependent epimerase/dehydratase family protein n=1 Tax=Streptomyces sp. MST-110588 TaxID=2833628 RepID=UPI001F5CB996|nr:NAD-dependent epimerase/dehydratase family protein [Streptomyces sp. MST-110588]UNO43193.1 NAD-dependent epimerase/dehydratase family protein [Streptomyces sp. MST-110588]
MAKNTKQAGGGKRVVVVGATGNVGTSVVQALAEDPDVASVLGIARRVPDWTPPKAEWASADIGQESGRATLGGRFAGADAVINLAWLFQPTHNPAVTWSTNVLGGIAVFRAAAEAEVPALIHASSVGAYSPGPKDRAVDESWPTHGWPEAAYCREKSYLERVLDDFERTHTGMRVVRMRPGFLFKEAAASEQRRLFAGPLVPGRLVRPGLLPFVPDIPGLRFQVLHTDDAADAFRRAVHRDVRGAFNLAAGPPVDAELLAGILHARTVRLPRRAARAAVSAAWGLRLVPASPHLLGAALTLPLMDCARAHAELDWHPEHTAVDALREFLRGLRRGSGMHTPPLAARVRGGRAHELATGAGVRP